MKKIIEMIFVGTIMLTVAGCQNHKKSTIIKQTGVGKVQKTNNSNDDNDKGNRTFGSNSNTSDSTWNSEKQDTLDDFFDDWATTMNQEYEKYDGDGQITTAAGEKFPRDFNRVYVNGQKVSLSYEPSGKGNTDYNVVAIYNEVYKYGVIAPEGKNNDDLYNGNSFVEKLPVAKVPSDLAIIGRYLLTPEIFDILATQKPGCVVKFN